MGCMYKRDLDVLQAFLVLELNGSAVLNKGPISAHISAGTPQVTHQCQYALVFRREYAYRRLGNITRDSYGSVKSAVEYWGCLPELLENHI